MQYNFRMREKWRGLFICVLVALSAAFLGSQYQTPVLLIALLLGMSSSFLAESPDTRPGIDFAAGTVLRIGVALLGFRIAVGDLAALGWVTVALLVIAGSVTIASGVLLARVLGLDQKLGALSGGAVAICGVSAAIAISSVMPRSRAMDQHLAVTIVTVTVFGSVAMVFYPALVSMAHLDTVPAGLFLGASIHDVSHVVGAGYSISPEVGDVAVLAKMIRVALLIPVVWGFFWVFRNDIADSGNPRKWPLPWFLLAFVAFAACSTAGLVADGARVVLDSVSRWMLIVAIVALGMKTSVPAMLSNGWRPIALVLGESLLLGALVLIWCLLI